MSSVIRWDPFRELQDWTERMTRLVGTAVPVRRETDEGLVAGTWAPPVDIVETHDKITLRAELPGFKESQVDLTVEDGVLTLRGERKFEKSTEEENYHRMERSYGTFVRSFTLPNNIDQGRIEAKFADGVLSVEMPKREEAKPKQIKITAGSSPREVDVKRAK